MTGANGGDGLGLGGEGGLSGPTHTGQHEWSELKIAYLKEPSWESNSEVKLLHGSEIHTQNLLFSMLFIPVRPRLVTLSLPD